MSKLLDNSNLILVSTTKHKEDLSMKTAILYLNHYMNQPHIDLPNAATRRQIVKKHLDQLLLCASGVGIAVVLLFLAAVF